jgi:predicted HTH transcriptional regulator
MNQPPTQNIAPEHHLDGASLTVEEAARFDDLLKHLTEGLNVEVKTWISADDPNSIAKIVRGVFALRNRNGGYFVVGFDNKTLQPDTQIGLLI